MPSKIKTPNLNLPQWDSEDVVSIIQDFVPAFASIDEADGENQKKTDNTLTTVDKTIIGAINELDTAKIDTDGDSSDTTVAFTDSTELYPPIVTSTPLKTLFANIKKWLVDIKSHLFQLSNPNLLINGGFEVWQRGTSFTNLQPNQYTADRFSVFTQITSGVNVSKPYDGALQYDVPSGTGVTSLQYIMEIPPNLRNKEVTLSFSIKGNRDQSNIMIVATNSTLSENYHVMTYDVSSTNQIITTTFQMPNVDRMNIWLCRTENLSEPLSLTLNWVKLELGSIATPFMPVDKSVEEIKCKRYYRICSTNTMQDVDLIPSMRLPKSQMQITQVTGGYAYDAEIR